MKIQGKTKKIQEQLRKNYENVSFSYQENRLFSYWGVSLLEVLDPALKPCPLSSWRSGATGPKGAFKRSPNGSHWAPLAPKALLLGYKHEKQDLI